MKRITALFVALFFIITTSAQIKYEKRLEFELKDNYHSEKIVPLKKNGFLLLSENNKSRKGQTEWRYELYNTALEVDDSRSIFLEKAYGNISVAETDNSTHSLYQKRNGEFQLVSYLAGNAEIIKVNGQLPKKFGLDNSYIMGDQFYASGRIKGAISIFSINWKTGNRKILPITIAGYKPTRISVVDFQTIEDSKEIFVFVKAYTKAKESEIHVIRFSIDGEKIEQYKINQKDDKNLISLSASKINDKEYILTGTYSSFSAFSSQGLFFAKINDQELSYINYYKFTELNEFLNYLPKKKQEKIEKKKKKKAKKGKEYNLSYNIASHDVIQLDDGYLYLGEAYYPTYTTYTTTSTVNGVTTTTTHTVFNGYQYTHAVAAKFNKQGDMVWDVCFEMFPSYKPFSRIRFISIAGRMNDRIDMVFANRDQIVSKSIAYSNGEILQDKTSEDIKTASEDDQTRRSFSSITHWYENYFLAYGVQKIKNKKEGKRTVFFINKISY